MVHSRVFVPVVPTVVVVSGHETHHAAVGPYDGQELVKVPGEADGVCGFGVYGYVTWARKITFRLLVSRLIWCYYKFENENNLVVELCSAQVIISKSGQWAHKQCSTTAEVEHLWA